MENSPYEPPPKSADLGTFNQPELPRTSGTPKVWPWYVGYCALMALLYLLCLVGGIFMLANSVWLAEQSDEQPLMFVIQGVVFTAFGALLLILYAAAPFLPRTKWAWYYGFATIGIGMTSVCCVPFTIPLLILWIKDDTKIFFGVRSSQNSSK